ncbi:MAG: HDOD domain-containing protein [Acidobacteria bacterium]|nr:HDOD domain-containing protein [Acidobacteriota bacterium]
MSEELSLLEQALAFAEKRQITLPVFSDVARKVQKASREERYDISEIERAIESDPALVAEVLRAANSAFFGGLSEVSSIRAAVLRLGLQRVANLVFLASEKSRYNARHPEIAGLMRDLWHHASACALAAEWISRKVRFPQHGETVFIGALVHDIGKLFLLRVLDDMAREPEYAAVSPELIREMLDNAHTEVGHRLLVSWHLPEVFQTIVRDHHVDVPDPGNIPLQIVRLANHACNKVGIGLRPQPEIVLGAGREAATLGMSEIAIAELEIILEDVMAQSVAAAFALG